MKFFNFTPSQLSSQLNEISSMCHTVTAQEVSRARKCYRKFQPIRYFVTMKTGKHGIFTFTFSYDTEREREQSKQ